MQNAASHLGLFYLLTKFSSKNEMEMKNHTRCPKNENGLIQMIRMGKSIRHKWVKVAVGSNDVEKFGSTASLSPVYT